MVEDTNTESAPRNSDLNGVSDIPVIEKIERIAISRKKISKIEWRNRDFLDVNGLDAEFENCDFRYSIFERAYFRNAVFKNCQFDGVRFIDCNFRNAKFYRCIFKFANFSRTLVDSREIVACLPSEPNIRRELIQNLQANALEIGDFSSVGLLALKGIEAEKQHYIFAMRGHDSYYRQKYSSLLSKFRAALSFMRIASGGLIWGHGERPWRLLLSCILGLVCLSFVNLWSVVPKVGWNETNSGLSIFAYVVRLFLDMPVQDTFRGFLMIDYIVVIMRYVYIGLFISILYKSISHR